MGTIKFIDHAQSANTSESKKTNRFLIIIAILVAAEVASRIYIFLRG